MFVCAEDSDAMLVRRLPPKFRDISTNAGTMKVAQVKPSTSPVTDLDTAVFSQTPKIVNDQSIAAGINPRNNQKRGGGSVSAMFRQSGYAANPTTMPR